MKNSLNISKVCVIGSGVMGAGIAALIANSSTSVVLLDIAGNDSNNKNSVLIKALENLQKQKPLALSFPDKINFITIGNLDDDLDLIRDCDLVIEVIIEKLEIKHQLYNKIIPYLSDRAIIASNTSTLPLKRLKENLPPSLQSRFIITHFFNPPRYMELLELVLDSTVSAEVIEKISGFLSKKLGKTIVKCNDTPGFIANRVGCFLLELVVREAVKSNLDPVIIDSIFTTQFKLPSTGIFGLYDLIGHDVMKLISNSLISSLPENDYYREIYLNTPILDKMLENKLIGRKGEGGFYRISLVEGKRIKEIINFSDLSYKPVIKFNSEFNSIEELLKSDSPYGKFFSKILTKFYFYLTNLISEVTDNIYDIDLAMKLGYSWRYGPFELLTSHIKDGFVWVTAQADSMQLPLSTYMKNHSYRDIDKERFYTENNITKNSKVILENSSAKLVLYESQFVFVINTKMNCLNKAVFNLLLESVEIAENKKQNLYICPESSNFSAGADLKFILACIENKDFTELETFLKLGQKTMMRLKYSSVNIVSCAYGVALGGGCEILLHSNFIVANQELNAGLVEIGVGLIPGWGGLKEMFIRSDGDKYKLVRNLQNILAKNKSNSADYFKHDYAVERFQVNINKYFILEEALKIKLTAKETQHITSITLPKVNFVQEINISGYNEFQKKILLKFQDIIDRYIQISEEELLTIEREMFLELAKDPGTHALLKQTVG